MGQFFRIQDLGAIAPELELMLWGMIVLIADLIVKDKKILGYFSIVGHRGLGRLPIPFAWRRHVDIQRYARG